MKFLLDVLPAIMAADPPDLPAIRTVSRAPDQAAADPPVQVVADLREADLQTVREQVVQDLQTVRQANQQEADLLRAMEKLSLQMLVQDLPATDLQQAITVPG